jgi:RimJ/RimL family protein N-acetyltransferase
MSTAFLKKTVAAGEGPGSCPIIETQRLVLRPHRMEDADAMAQSLNDWQVTRMLARVPLPYSRDDARDWLNRQRSGALPGWNLAITEGDGVHIGCIGLEPRHGLWHLGYWLNRFYWGHGLMSEAAFAAIERFQRRMPETVLYSGAFADNAASLRIQAKLGFTVTGSGEVFSLARNRMAPHIETRLDPGALRDPAAS